MPERGTIMGTDFFDELGETLSRTAKEFGERAESIYETQKLRAKISGEERAVSKLMAELGKTLYKVYVKGGELTEEQVELCGKIDRHKEIISRYKDEMSGKKGKKYCPCCGEEVEKYMAFCPFCGAACPTEEHEEKAGETVEEPVQTEEDAAGTEETPEAEETAEETPESESEETAEEADGTPEAAAETDALREVPEADLKE